MICYCNRTKDDLGNSSKTYVFDNGKRMSFERYSTIKDKNFKSRCGGETIVKESENHVTTFNSFSIDKDILIEALYKFGINKIENNKKCTCDQNNDEDITSPWCWKCNAFK